jgi:hypothetical protein
MTTGPSQQRPFSVSCPLLFTKTIFFSLIQKVIAGSQFDSFLFLFFCCPTKNQLLTKKIWVELIGFVHTLASE